MSTHIEVRVDFGTSSYWKLKILRYHLVTINIYHNICFKPLLIKWLTDNGVLESVNV